MSVLGQRLEGASVLDLFAGTGALGLEVLSRGASRVTFVERSGRALECLRANIAALEADELATVIKADVFDYVSNLEARAFDVALADPPYGGGLAARLLRHFRRHPFAQILSVEHDSTEPIDLWAEAEQRRYGDTVITLADAADFQEETI